MYVKLETIHFNKGIAVPSVLLNMHYILNRLYLSSEIENASYIYNSPIMVKEISLCCQMFKNFVQEAQERMNGFFLNSELKTESDFDWPT